MQKSTGHFINNCVKCLPIEGPVYEFGSLQVHEDRPPEELRPFFTNQGLEFVGCDMRPGPGVDQVQNLHDLDIEDGTVGCIVCMDTLEHVEFPRQAMDEMWRILKPDGIAIMSSVFEFPIHGYPNDYWRFTPEGFRSLFRRFESTFIYSYGRNELNPQTVAGVGFKGKQPDIETFDIASKNWEIWFSEITKDLKQDMT